MDKMIENEIKNINWEDIRKEVLNKPELQRLQKEVEYLEAVKAILERRI